MSPSPPEATAVGPRQLDLVTAAHGPDPLVPAAWERWRGLVDWRADLEPGEFELLPAVHRTLGRLGVEDPLLPRLKGVVRQSVLRNGRRMAAWVRVLEATGRAGVAPVLVPPSWTWVVDPSTVTFPVDAFHACVREDETDRTIRALLSAGWEVTGSRIPARWLPGYVRGAGAIVLGRGGDRVRLVLGLPGGLSAAPDEVWSRAVAVTVAGRRVRRLGATDGLEMALRHAGGRGFLGAAESVLGILAAGDDVDRSRIESALAAMPLARESRTELLPLAPWLERAGVRVDLGPAEEPGPVPTPALGGLARARRDWLAYRATWGGGGSLAVALAQFPGFLMGRYGITTPLGIPRGVVEWARRGGPSSRRHAR